MPARKRQLLIWITAALLFCLTTYPIHPARASDEDRKGYRELLEYIGDVGVNSVIRVTIEKQGQHLSGTYFYKRTLKDITLEGEYITDRDIVLHELDSHGIAGATFSLTFAEKDPRGHFTGDQPLKEEVLTGSWSNSDNTVSHPVYLYLIGERELAKGETRYTVAGSTNDALAEKNAQAFYFAVLKGNRLLAAKYVDYPLFFNLDRKQAQARNSREFLRDYNSIFTKDFVSRVAEGIPHNMWASDQGIRLGNGEVWFDGSGKASHLNN